MKRISILVKPASSFCNMRCKYCFYANVSSLREVRTFGNMTKETTEKMIENLYKDLDDGDQLTIGFQGGEPTMAGLPYYQHLMECIDKQSKNVHVNFAIQTNGTLIDEKWCEFFKQHNFLVGLSIDAARKFHDTNRLDSCKKGTFDRVLKTKKLFDQYEIQYNVLTVLTEQLSNHAEEVFTFLLENDIKYVQFIPCLDKLDKEPDEERSEYALTPQGFHKFYSELLPLWLNELKNKNYISIKYFDDIFNLIVRRQATACGIIGVCQVQFVIEGDGSVYPCDFFALDEYRMGYIQKKGLKELFYQKAAQTFLNSRKPADLSQKCKTCKYYNICRGGCKRMKDAQYVDETANFCGHQACLDEFVPEIHGIIDVIRAEESRI